MRGRRGLTLIEVVVVLGIVVIAAIAALIVMGKRVQRRLPRSSMQDAVNVRVIEQAMSIWAMQNNGLYPLPSAIDAANTTVSEQGKAKDHTANIYSLLVYTGGVSVESLVSDVESNSDSIVMDEDYEFDRPKAAVQPANAMWDPAFRADFTSGKPGNTSFAHVTPGGTRAGKWRDAAAATEPIAANRGPEIKSIARDAAGNAVPTFVLASSKTFLIHGAANAWEGHVAYNDGHTALENRVDPAAVTYADTAGKVWTDCLFFDEPDDAAGVNAWMSIWSRAGSANAEFKGIWD